MNAPDQFELLGALGYAVFERMAEGSFVWLGGASEWVPRGPLAEAFPFLEVFLPDAEELWSNPGADSRLRSDFWTQMTAAKEEIHFRAIAVAGKRRLLLIERIGQRFEQARASVHYAHKTKLDEEEIARLNLELERATEAKSEFLARMSHEIRTPMNSLLGVAELLAETSLSAEQSEYVRIFRRAGDNLLNVINDILDFSKVEAGQIDLECVTFELADVVQGAADLVCVRARAKGLSLRYEIQPDVAPRWKGDPGRLRQILLNLLGNAVKFTERGGITVRVENDLSEDAPALHFSIADTGAGIPADKISTIFDSFTQADASTTRKYGGTGLGLAISKRFVELMGGRIWAESTPGEGSTIHFTVRFGAAEPGEAREASVPKSAVNLRPLRILLADDSSENRFLIRGYLRETGSAIEEVENGAEAVETFKRGDYDVVLMDAEMPVMDGYAATRAMRTLEKEKGKTATPIFALTAHALKAAKERSLESGFTEHLTKPIRKATLLEAIGRHVPDAAVAPRIHVEVESWLKPVVPAYLEKCRADVAAIRSALERRDYAAIRTLGHQMNGTGAGYGFVKVTEIGSALEESALAEDAARIEQEVGALDRYLSSVEIN